MKSLEVNGMNESGVVVGTANSSDSDASPRSQAFVHQNGVTTLLETPLSAPPPPAIPPCCGLSFQYFGSTGIAINDIGQVAGNSYFKRDQLQIFVSYRPFVYDNGNVTCLFGDGTCVGDGSYSFATNINDEGVMLFSSGVSSRIELGQAASIWAYDTKIGTGATLNHLAANVLLPGYNASGPVDINNNGAIVATMTSSFNGVYVEPRALLLTPIPEPSKYVMLMVGGIAMIAVAKRRRVSR